MRSRQCGVSRKNWIVGLTAFFCICCNQQMDGVACVNSGDCAGGICSNGICIGDGNINTESEPTDSDTRELKSLTAVDVLFIVDNSGSMKQEQSVLSSSIFALMNGLYDEMIQRGGIAIDAVDVRVGVTSSDMGVSYNGQPYLENFDPHPVCTKGDGFGNNGRMFTFYPSSDSVAISVPVEPQTIPCHESGSECPADWLCMWLDNNGEGRCTPIHEQTTTECPDVASFVAEDGFLSLGNSAAEQYGYQQFVSAVACMSSVGLEGCAFEQQLAAIPAAFHYGAQERFLRADAMTLIIVVSDEDDCSLGSNQWHEVHELGTNESNIACGTYPEYMTDVTEIYEQIQAAKTTAVGEDARDTIMFAAIVGVPLGPFCEGFGDDIVDCMNVSLANGTMGAPSVVQRPDPNDNLAFYFEYACERYEDGETVTQAYPATRIVQLAQQFGEYGYVYSVCNGDWTHAMQALVAKMAVRLF
ncbi:MAG: hypothetical protein JXX29_20155 [Deltaproteobacteria bacterium]|nr:hypothetical protein [Deltaproteobacteria bacterium]MBN2674006.1 hypothetical protein [Deltaproteobacteria bacterium]